MVTNDVRVLFAESHKVSLDFCQSDWCSSYSFHAIVESCADLSKAKHINLGRIELPIQFDKSIADADVNLAFK